MARLDVELAGLRLVNPFILASGIWGETGATLVRALRAGAAAVVTKSISLEPRPGYANPTVVGLPYGLLNAMGLPNPGIEAYKEEVEEALGPGKPVFGSIFGANSTEFMKIARKMETFGVHALELNLSCPHAKGYGSTLGQDPDMTKRITAAVKSVVRIPVFVKLTPNVASIASLARAAESGGADGVSAINTLRGMVIDLELARPVLSHGSGGYSGSGVKPVGVWAVHEIASTVDIPVIGMGGISTGEDAAEYMMAGATAVQVGTAVIHGRENTFARLSKELGAFLDTRGYRRASRLTGAARVKGGKVKRGGA
jgi:dihydroorotate dehydrogenase (NAD+) catalytic subunit